MSGKIRVQEKYVSYNEETGERGPDIPANSVIKTPELLESQRKYLEEQNSLVKLDKKFVKIFPDVLKEARRRNLLTQSEIVFITTVLINYVSFTDCVLRNEGISYGDPMDAKSIAENEGMSVSTVRNTISNLKKKRVLAYITTGGEAGYDVLDLGTTESKFIVMNPYFFVKGNIKARILSIFSGSVWEEIYFES